MHQDGRIVYANPAAAKIVGEDLMRDMGKPISSYLHPDYVKPTLERLSQLTEPGDAMKGYEAIIIRADGAQVPVEVASVRTSWGGKPAFQVIIRDMSERKLAEEAARARLALERRYADGGRRARRGCRRRRPKWHGPRGERVLDPDARHGDCTRRRATPSSPGPTPPVTTPLARSRPTSFR